MRMQHNLLFLSYMFLLVFQPYLVNGQGTEGTTTKGVKNPASNYNPRALDHFVRGMLYDDQGDYARAILEYQDATQYDSTASIFYYSMGEDYVFLRKDDNAIKMFEKYLLMEPRDLQVHQYLAELYKRNRQIGKLEWIMERMRWMDQYQPEFYYDLLQIYLINGKIKKAYDLGKELLTGSNTGETIYENVKGVYLATKKIPEGISLFEQIVLDNPKNGLAKYELGDLYIILGDSVRGQKNVEEAIALEPELVLAMQRLSELYLVHGSPEKALPWFDKIDVNHRLTLANHYFRVDADSIAEPLFKRIHDQFPDDPRPNLYLGVFAMREDNFDQAKTLFEKAIELDSTQDIYYFWAGNATFRLQIYEKAIKYFKKAADINSSNSDSYFWLAWSYFRLQKYRDAEENIKRVLDLKPGDKDAQDMLADIYYNQGKFSLAEELYIRLIQEDTTNVKAMNNYGYMLAERGIKLNEALRLSQQAVAKSPDNQSYLDTLGWIFYKLGRYKEALEYTLKAIQADSTESSPILYDHLGDIYYQLGDTQRARQYWQKVIELDRENNSVRRKIEQEEKK